VDFLGTHMISLVLFFRKPGVTVRLAQTVHLSYTDSNTVSKQK
jgi:hypothetical protein